MGIQLGIVGIDGPFDSIIDFTSVNGDFFGRFDAHSFYAIKLT